MASDILHILTEICCDFSWYKLDRKRAFHLIGGKDTCVKTLKDHFIFKRSKFYIMPEENRLEVRKKQRMNEVRRLRSQKLNSEGSEITIKVRHSQGSLTRRFMNNDTWEDLINFIGSFEEATEQFTLSDGRSSYMYHTNAIHSKPSMFDAPFEDSGTENTRTLQIQRSFLEQDMMVTFASEHIMEYNIKVDLVGETALDDGCAAVTLLERPLFGVVSMGISDLKLHQEFQSPSEVRKLNAALKPTNRKVVRLLTGC